MNEYIRQNLGIQINNQYEAIFIYGLKTRGKKAFSRRASNLACPARFERATYALEAQKSNDFNSVFNMLDLVEQCVVFAVNLLASNGI